MDFNRTQLALKRSAGLLSLYALLVGCGVAVSGDGPAEASGKGEVTADWLGADWIDDYPFIRRLRVDVAASERGSNRLVVRGDFYEAILVVDLTSASPLYQAGTFRIPSSKPRFVTTTQLMKALSVAAAGKAEGDQICFSADPIGQADQSALPVGRCEATEFEITPHFFVAQANREILAKWPQLRNASVLALVDNIHADNPSQRWHGRVIDSRTTVATLNVFRERVFAHEIFHLFGLPDQDEGCKNNLMCAALYKESYKLEPAQRAFVYSNQIEQQWRQKGRVASVRLPLEQQPALQTLGERLPSARIDFNADKLKALLEALN